MLHAILEILLSLLAVFGLFSLGWVFFGKLLVPGDTAAPVYAVVPAQGDGGDLEQTVKGLLWLRGGELQRYTVVIADAGLDPRGLQIATVLANQESRVILCPMDRLEEYLL